MFEKFQSIINDKIDEYTNGKIDTTNSNLYDEFKTPIEYLEPQYLHKIDPIVASDLEIQFNESNDTQIETQTIYDHLMNPQDVFHKRSIIKNDIYTTHVDFLKDTQNDQKYGFF